MTTTALPGFDADPVFEAEEPARVVPAWTPYEASVLRVWEGDTLRGYLWRGLRDRSIGYIRQDDSPGSLAYADEWNARIFQATQAENFSPAAVLQRWQGHDDGTTRVEATPQETTLAALMESVHRD